MSCRVVSCRVVSCRVVSCRVVSCRVVSCRVVSCRVVSCRVVWLSNQCLCFSCAAYSLKHARDLVRAITKKVKHPAHYIMKDPSMRPGVHQVNLAPWNSQVPRVTSAGAKGFPAFRKPPMRRQLGYVKAQ